MSAHFPSSETLRAALSLASRAPSVHNSQPWQWRVGERSLHLYSNPDLALPHTDPDGRDLILSCGAALNHCVIAFAALGWQSKVHRLPNPEDATHLASIELHPHSPSEVDIALAAAIPRRRTDRRRYSSWPVPHGDIAVMGARAARSGVTLRRADSPAHLRAVVVDAACRHAGDLAYLSELTMWSGKYGSTAGVPARNAPEPDPSAVWPARQFAGTALSDTPDGASDNAVVMGLGTRDDDPSSRLRAGEATSIVLLTATSVGLASCPITEPLEIAETRTQLGEDIFDSEYELHMLLRVGWAPINADPLPSTPRRALSEVATRLDGSPLA